MASIELSFCIPTYNRADSVQRLVTSILKCPDPDIEIVVLDNGSTDDTLNRLRAIPDSRLLVYANGENKGALFNMVNVIDKANGRFLVYSTDQDHVDSGAIRAFKLFLARQRGLTCGFCEFHSVSPSESAVFDQGYPAIHNIAYKSRHPTGYFFNNAALKSVDHLRRFADYDFVDLFPLEFIFAELCMLGTGAIYYRPTFAPETGTMVVKHKSSTTDGSGKKAFFAPAARTKLAISYARHVATLNLPAPQKRLLTSTIFCRGLMAATLEYKRIMANEALCVHYYMQTRTVGAGEVWATARDFCRQFEMRTVDLREPGWGGRLRFRAGIAAAILSRAVGQVGKRLAPGRA